MVDFVSVSLLDSYTIVRMHALASPDQVVVCQHPLHTEGEGDSDSQGEALCVGTGKNQEGRREYF